MDRFTKCLPRIRQRTRKRRRRRRKRTRSGWRKPGGVRPKPRSGPRSRRRKPPRKKNESERSWRIS